MKQILQKTRAREGNGNVILTDLSLDVLSHVLYRLTFAHEIARAAQACRLLKLAAQLAFAARPYTREILTLSEHAAVVECVAAADDGQVLTGSDDKTVKVWRGDELVRTIKAHGNWVMAVVALPGGARFISGSRGTAKLFSIGGELERTFEVGSVVECIEALPDGVHFVVGLGNNEVRLYEVDGPLVHAFYGHTNSVYTVGVTRDGQHIISGADDNLIKVWSVLSKSLVSTCTGHTEGVVTVAAMPDGQRILSGSDDTTVRVWLLDGTLDKTFSELHTGWVGALVALPDNQHALSASDDNTVKLFNANNGDVMRTFTHHTGSVYSLALLPDGLRFVSGSDDFSARVVEHGLCVK